jgi:predicted DNA-binding antitoxin AbrB/MazE fold protein
MTMTFGAFITAQHQQPVLNVDRTEKFNSHSPLQKSNKKIHWNLLIKLKDLFLKEGETLVVQVIEKTHIQERIQDWKKRINELFSEVKEWTKEQSDLS